MLGPHGELFFAQRKIDIETVVRYGIITGKKAGHEIVPSETGDIIVIPYIEHGVVVNEKYRTLDKKFWQWPKRRATFFNSDILDDPQLQTGTPLIITEGELDCLVALDCGFPFSVSVPDGAPPPTRGEAQAKLEYLWNNRERLKKVKRFILAVDADPPGQRLADELCRTLSASRCSYVTYPDGCKDLNDVVMQHGPQGVTKVIAEARPYPVRGLYHLSDYPERQPLETFSTGWPMLDQHFRLFRGGLTVVTGVPSHGKSAWCLNLLVNVARNHGWRAAIFSPEMPTMPVLRDRLMKLHGGDKPTSSAFIEDRFVFIDSDPVGDDDEVFTLDWVLDKATEAVLRDGINLLLLDPWNELEHAREKDENITDYIGRALRAIKRFARLRNVAVIVVAHPTKEVRNRDGKTRTPSLYDVEGSAHWFNKCDHGIIIERPNDFLDQAKVCIAKSRFEEAGVRGDLVMAFDRMTGRFGPLQ